MEDDKIVSKGDILFYARILKNLDEYDLLELKVRTVEDTWFAAYDLKTSHAYIFSYNDIGNIIFANRNICLDVVNQAKKNNF